MKKLFTAALGTLMIFGLAACGGSSSGGSTPTPTPEPEVKPEEIVRSLGTDDEGHELHVCAQGGALGWELDESLEMEAKSVKDVKALNAALGAKLEAKMDSLVGLYVREVKLEGEAGWTSNVKKDGVVSAVDGANTIKARAGYVDAETEAWVSSAWYPDPHTQHAESLTPETLFVAENWAEEADEDGFDWTTNPAAFEQGEYVFVAAMYDVPASPTAYSVGMALLAK